MVKVSDGIERMTLDIHFHGDNENGYHGSAEIGCNGIDSDVVRARGNDANSTLDVLDSKIAATLNELMYRSIPRDVDKAGRRVLNLVNRVKTLTTLLGAPNEKTVSEIIREFFDVCGYKLNITALNIETPLASNESTPETRV